MFKRSAVHILAAMQILLCFQNGASGQYMPDPRAQARQLSSESVALIQSQKYERAEQKLSVAYQIDPNDQMILNNYGMCLLKLGKLSQAREILTRAVQLYPNFDLAYMNLGLVCEGLGDLPAARDYLSRFVELAPRREEVEKTRDHIRIIEKTLAAGVSTNTGGEDYLAQIPRDKLQPWPKERNPIKIYIAPADGVPGYRPSFGQDLNRAIYAWSQALKGVIDFGLVERPEQADISIHWEHGYKNALMKAEGGDCRTLANGEGLQKATITLLTDDPSSTDKLNDARVNWVALHEIGHALGISGHSNNPKDVMYFAVPLTDDMPVLSARDVKSFFRLYTEKLSDTWLSLNDQAIRLMKAGKVAEALDKLNAAYKINPSERVLRENLLIAEARLSSELLAAGKINDAEPHLLRALDLEKEFHNESMPMLLANYAQLLKMTGRSDQVSDMYKKYGAAAP
ncbi:MAG: tetratricopeptide repeat protein [Candidatus Obscuribacterales bacterium]|nr:tetratricopeptide repeat protein [Candidatus Obscuribacterales bacterium]